MSSKNKTLDVLDKVLHEAALARAESAPTTPHQRALAARAQAVVIAAVEIRAKTRNRHPLGWAGAVRDDRCRELMTDLRA